MAHILIPNRWRRQPQYPVVLREELRGYSRSFIMGSQDIIGVDGRPITYSASKAGYFSKGVGPGGIYIGNGTTNTTVNCYTKAETWAVTDPFSLVFYSRLDESKTALTTVIQQGNYGYLSAGNGTNANVCFAARYSGDAQGTAKITDPTGYTVGKDTCYVLTYKSGKQELWKDGQLVGTGTDTTGLVSNSGNAVIYPWPSFYLAGAVKRAFESAEAQEISKYPYSVLVPQENILYFPVSASVTIPTLSSPGVTNILTTSATPQVTLTF